MVSTNLGDQGGGRVYIFFCLLQSLVSCPAIGGGGDLPQVAQNSSVGMNVFMSTRLLQEGKKKKHTG